LAVNDMAHHYSVGPDRPAAGRSSRMTFLGQSTGRARSVALALATSGTLLLAACGGDDATTTSGSGAGAAQVTVGDVTVKKDQALADSLPDRVKKAGVVNVASNAPYAPFVDFKQAGSQEFVGGDVDMAKAIGAKLGVEFKFKQLPFEGLILSVQSKQNDVVIGGLTDSKERQATLDFVDYSASGTGILVKKGNPEGIKGLTDLCGKSVATQKATTQSKLIDSTNKKECASNPIKKLEVPAETEAQLALKSGRAAAELATLPASTEAAKKVDGGNAFELVEDPANPNGIEASPNGIGIAKDQTQLRDAIQKALQALIDDGSMKKILAKWNLEKTLLEKATINGGTS
jgi:polar amino acid transport system substrate-binding protein